MLPGFITLVLVTLPAGQGVPQSEDPRAVVWTAIRAVEGDSAAKFRTRWSSRVARSPADRSAVLGLATLNRLQYDYPAAEAAYRGLIAAGNRHAVYARLGLAEGLEARSMGRDARAEFDRALASARAIGDRLAEAQALLFLAFSRGRLEGVQVAEAVLDTATRLIPDTALTLQAILQSRRAITHALRGRPSQASLAADSSAVLARRAGAGKLEADAFRVQGQVFQYRGQWDSAFAALQHSQELYLRAHNRSALASSLIWHAQVLGSQGRYGEMREVMRRGLAEGEATHNPAAIGDAQRAFGVLASMFGDWTAAANHLRQAAAISVATGDSSGLLTTQTYLARVALVAGDTATASRIARERLDWARRTLDAGQHYQAQRFLADIAERRGDTLAANLALADARERIQTLPGASYRIWLLHDEARHAVSRGNLATAARLLESFIAGEAGAIGDILRFDARVRLADVYARQGDVQRAERELVTATDDLDRWRAGLADAQLRTLAFQIVATVDAAAEPDIIASSAARVVAAIVKAGRTEAAFSLAERWRARALMDQLVRAASLRADRPVTGLGGLTATPPRTASEIIQSIPDGRSALLQFVAAPDAPVTAFTVQRGRIAGRVLAPIPSLGEDVSRFRGLLESGADASRLGRTLGAALLDFALAELDSQVTRVVIVPDGPLHRLAFDGLRLRDGRYLLERYALAFAPSASVAATLWGRQSGAPVTGPVRILSYGDPSTADGKAGAVRGPASEEFLASASAAGGLPRLAGAAREARQVARYAEQSEVRLGRDASAAYLTRSDLRPFRVLHFATHAIVDERSVAGTALVLAPSQDHGGFVGTGDLAALRLNADLIVLSACTSAGGALASGEGVQGLTSALLQAGTRAVVATGWRIRDRDVVPLVEGLYGALARGLPLIDALHAAKLESWRRGTSPRTWAAFMAIGDPLVQVPLRTPPQSWLSRLLGR